MSDQQRRILDMLAAGKITADDAERLLRALESAGAQADESDDGDGAGEGAGKIAVVDRGQRKLKYLRVVVDDPDGEHHKGRVNVRIPLALLRAGIKLAALLPAQAGQAISDAFQQKGIPFDPQNLKPEQVEEFINTLGEVEITVEQGKATVRVFCE